jgi:hypothetical protein
MNEHHNVDLGFNADAITRNDLLAADIINIHNDWDADVLRYDDMTGSE